MFCSFQYEGLTHLLLDLFLSVLHIWMSLLIRFVISFSNFFELYKNKFLVYWLVFCIFAKLTFKFYFLVVLDYFLNVKKSFLFLFQEVHILFIYFSCHIALARTSSTILSRRSGESRNLCVFPNLRSKVFSISPLNIIVAVALLYMPFIWLKYLSFNSSFAEGSKTGVGVGFPNLVRPCAFSPLIHYYSDLYCLILRCRMNSTFLDKLYLVEFIHLYT